MGDCLTRIELLKTTVYALAKIELIDNVL